MNKNVIFHLIFFLLSSMTLNCLYLEEPMTVPNRLSLDCFDTSGSSSSSKIISAIINYKITLPNIPNSAHTNTWTHHYQDRRTDTFEYMNPKRYHIHYEINNPIYTLTWSPSSRYNDAEFFFASGPINFKTPDNSLFPNNQVVIKIESIDYTGPNYETTVNHNFSYEITLNNNSSRIVTIPRDSKYRVSWTADHYFQGFFELTGGVYVCTTPTLSFKASDIYNDNMEYIPKGEKTIGGWERIKIGDINFKDLDQYLIGEKPEPDPEAFYWIVSSSIVQEGRAEYPHSPPEYVDFSYEILGLSYPVEPVPSNTTLSGLYNGGLIHPSDFKDSTCVKEAVADHTWEFSFLLISEVDYILSINDLPNLHIDLNESFSRKFNCHSFAWFTVDDNPKWISSMKGPNFSKPVIFQGLHQCQSWNEDVKVVIFNKEGSQRHSAIVETYNEDIYLATFKSKLGSLYTCSHNLADICHVYYDNINELEFYSNGFSNKRNINDNETLNYLVDNYPNPFNPETTISFDLPQDTDVQLKIYNIKGQRVKTIQNGHMLAGNHKFVWNGTNGNNEKVSSGIYFYRLIADKRKLTRKMILMK